MRYLFSYRDTPADLPTKLVCISAPNLKATMRTAHALDLLYENEHEREGEQLHGWDHLPCIEVNERGEMVINAKGKRVDGMMLKTESGVVEVARTA